MTDFRFDGLNRPIKESNFEMFTVSKIYCSVKIGVPRNQTAQEFQIFKEARVLTMTTIYGQFN